MEMPHKLDCFDSIFCYDYRIHKLGYDVKCYLNDNNWCFDKEGKRIIRQITEQELKILDRYKDTVEKHERDNISWINHKQCRKRSCICKKCERCCHCYECVNKITTCNNSV